MDDYEIPQRGSAALRFFTLFLALAAGVLGTHLYEMKFPRAQLLGENADIRNKLAECDKGREGEKAAREVSQKDATEKEAALGASRAELEDLRRDKQETEKRLAVFQAITDKLRKMIDSGKLSVAVRHGRMVVKLPASVLFPSGSAELSKDGQTALTEVAHILRQFPERRFEVAGHTDNVKIGPPSPFKSNLELSTARALTVATYLVGAGMSPARLSAAGYSEHQPVASNAHESGRQENRRIEIVLLPNISELPPMPGEGDAGAPKPGDAGAADAAH
jgi:chemotaxis protein MotB